MPHSITGAKSSPGAVKDEPMDDSGVASRMGPAASDGDDVDMDHDADDVALVKNDIKLTDMVDTDESDDEEFPSSAPVKQPPSSPPARIPSPTDIGALKASDPEVMRSFYQRLFPWRQLFQWLNHSPTPTNDFGNREFAFTLQNDAYLRYQSFATADLLRKDVLRLMPSRFEIGPVYSTNPRDRKMLRNSSAFKPLAKELCFDIDLTDYDDIRTCCDKANICNKCWKFMTMAIKVVDVALREDFGFKHIMWVYSGRRGAHAWVCDKKVRSLDDQKRKAIAGYLEVVKGGAQSGKKVNVRRPLHPHLARSLEILKTHFQEDVLEVQDPWGTEERYEKLLQLLPDRNLNESLRRKWDAAPGRASVSKWADIDALAKTGASKNLDARALLEAKQDIVLEYTYPRLDIEVSKKLNHLLKSPFVVHPGTGRVCVPIDTRELEDFDPLAVPTVQELLGEIDSWKGDDGAASQDDNGKGISDWEKTSLKPYVEYFRTFVNGIMKDERDVRTKREREDVMDF
ncbi:eukaryotic-type DNA primase [Metarhizium robertsii]|uniref:DNA primase n=2 Tax=Metarhizium robertsii TaxID=568076 RepID=E9EX03_METRA|nr:eukaryotic and archaeal DNA primase small subunit [Metarhizium robertsii ARSEF 23]EFY99623.1 eukaryotic and archaeal DNA primase small subunit [Metarhizium robertsii ARSEF 23]EXV06301.1 eukaryotic-type DNA primase [Metarhizium robertsii]